MNRGEWGVSFSPTYRRSMGETLSVEEDLRWLRQETDRDRLNQERSRRQTEEYVSREARIRAEIEAQYARREQGRWSVDMSEAWEEEEAIERSWPEEQEWEGEEWEGMDAARQELIERRRMLVARVANEAEERYAFETPSQEPRFTAETRLARGRIGRSMSPVARNRRSGSTPRTEMRPQKRQTISRDRSSPPPDAIRHFDLGNVDELGCADSGDEEASDDRTFAELVAKSQAEKTVAGAVVTVTARNMKGERRQVPAPKGTQWLGGWSAPSNGAEPTPMLTVLSEETAAALKVKVGTTMGVGACTEKGWTWLAVSEAPSGQKGKGKRGTATQTQQVHLDLTSLEEWQTQGGGRAGRGRGRGKGSDAGNGRGGSDGSRGRGGGRSSQSAGICHAFRRGECNRGTDCRFEHFQPETPGGEMHWATLSKERLHLKRSVEKTEQRQLKWPKNPTAARAKVEGEARARQRERVRVLNMYDKTMSGDAPSRERLRLYKAELRAKRETEQKGNDTPTETSGSSAGKKPATHTAVMTNNKRETQVVGQIGAGTQPPKAPDQPKGRDDDKEGSEARNAKNAKHKALREALARTEERKSEEEFGMMFWEITKLCDARGDGADFLRDARTKFLSKDGAVTVQAVQELARTAVSAPGRVAVLSNLMDRWEEGLTRKEKEERTPTATERDTVMALAEELRRPVFMRAVALEAMARTLTLEAKGISREHGMEGAAKAGVEATPADLERAGRYIELWVARLAGETLKPHEGDGLREAVDRMFAKEWKRETESNDKLCWGMLECWAARCDGKMPQAGLVDAMQRCERNAIAANDKGRDDSAESDRILSGAETASGDETEEDRALQWGGDWGEEDTPEHVAMTERVLAEAMRQAGQSQDRDKAVEAIAAIQAAMAPGQGVVSALDGKRGADSWGSGATGSKKARSEKTTDRAKEENEGEEEEEQSAGNVDQARRDSQTDEEEEEFADSARLEVRHTRHNTDELERHLAALFGSDARAYAQEGGGSYAYIEVDATEAVLMSIMDLAEATGTECTVRLATVDRAESKGTGCLLLEPSGNGEPSNTRAVGLANQIRDESFLCWVSVAEIARNASEVAVYMLRGEGEVARAVKEFPGRVTYAQAKLANRRREQIRRKSETDVAPVGMEVWAPKGMTADGVRKSIENNPLVKAYDVRVHNVTAATERATEPGGRTPSDKRWHLDLVCHWAARLALTNQRWQVSGGTVGIRVDPNDDSEGRRINRLKRSSPQLFMTTKSGAVSSKLTEAGLGVMMEELKRGVPPEGVEEPTSSLLQKVLADQSPAAANKTQPRMEASPRRERTELRPKAAAGMSSAARPQAEDRRAPVAARATEAHTSSRQPTEADKAMHETDVQLIASLERTLAEIKERTRRHEADWEAIDRRDKEAKQRRREERLARERAAAEEEERELTLQVEAVRERRREAETALLSQQGAPEWVGVAQAQSEEGNRKEQEHRRRLRGLREELETETRLLAAQRIRNPPTARSGSNGRGGMQCVPGSGGPGQAPAAREVGTPPTRRPLPVSEESAESKREAALEVEDTIRRFGRSLHDPKVSAPKSDRVPSMRELKKTLAEEQRRAEGAGGEDETRFGLGTPGREEISRRQSEQEILEEEEQRAYDRFRSWARAHERSLAAMEKEYPAGPQVERPTEGQTSAVGQPRRATKPQDSPGAGDAPVVVSDESDAGGGTLESEADSLSHSESEPTREPTRLERFMTAQKLRQARKEANARKEASRGKAAQRSASTPPPRDNPRQAGDCTPGWGDDNEWHGSEAWREYWADTGRPEPEGEEQEQEGEPSRGRQPTQPASKRAKSVGKQAKTRTGSVPLVGKTGEAVTQAKTALMRHTLRESSVTVPQRKAAEAYMQYEADRRQGEDETMRLKAVVKEAKEANKRAFESAQSPVATPSPAPARTTQKQADMRTFLSPRSDTKPPARELHAEFDATTRVEGQKKDPEGSEGSQDGSSA